MTRVFWTPCTMSSLYESYVTKDSTCQGLLLSSIIQCIHTTSRLENTVSTKTTMIMSLEQQLQDFRLFRVKTEN